MNRNIILFAISFVFIFSACVPLNDEDDVLINDPIENVFHDIEVLGVQDSASQLAVRVKILGWNRDKRSSYTLNYLLINDSTSQIVEQTSVPYNELTIQDNVLSRDLEFNDLDSATLYLLEFKTLFEDETSNADTYLLYTDGYLDELDSTNVE
ncbi:hypothetical protein KMW28_14860 [Flammeovirga yaeyamensis]|uniref:Uncharacterized protein n=1 Tax=Flammeovirga yaeyamensis TaxID=367791 RepID=A0AAX1N0S8_9BACT|nr:hypothetical protein [Flammeovirga yaeyamensis]MBB3700125.1 hypothetical protein [Flammeovirga yaeyamensis]NMF37244.1 hypothetical protein [Flammeovirga yaeyamensis]QWG00932.1 hypothetical protein KMW28_14860 [Flammeovirga yaeyamensis]